MISEESRRQAQSPRNGGGVGLLVLVGVLIIGAGCSDSAEDAVPVSGPVVRDSGGVRIVVNSEPQWDSSEGWRAVGEPLLTLGTEDGPPEERFFRIRGASRLSDGTVAVLDAGNHQLRFYGPDGEHAFSVGGAGDGPGEFRFPNHLERLEGDTLQITDGWFRIRYDGEGRLVAHDRLPPEMVLAIGGFRSEGCNVPSPLFLSTGVLLCEGNNDVRDMPQEPGPWLLQNTVVHAPWSLDRVDTLAAFLGKKAWVVVRGGRPFYTEPPMTAIGLFAVDGRQGRLAYANSHEYRLEVYSLHGGDLEMIVRMDGGERAPTDAELEEAWEEAERFLSSMGVGGLRTELPVPDLVSDATRIHFDALGSLWVRGRESRDTQRVRYEVFSEDGIWLGHLVLPARLTIFEIGQDYILGVERDVLDVERVVLYEIVRGVVTSSP